ncbi:MAG: FHA domain-containing protein [Verrucomicrobiales bacterium]|nr:FHA domain-containing protein [Verrucomicrobiales bacterium]
MLRYILRGTNQPFEYELHTGLNTVGRNPTNEFRIPEASVSSFHAEITVHESDGSVTVRDLQSTNGTFIAGQPVEEARLADGQQLQLGNVEMRLVVEEYDVKIPTGAGVQPALAAGTIQTLPDGTLACSRNPSLAATHQAIGGCQAVIKCPGVFNAASLRTTKLAGGKAGLLLFCTDCNAKCEPIPGVSDRPSPKKGLFSRLTQTILIGRKKG